MIKTDILFTGYYGYRNTGDDAFIEVTSWGAHEFWNKYKYRFLGNNENLPETIYASKGYPINLPKSYRFQNKFLIRNTNYLISSGGSTIHSAINKYNPKSIAVDLKKNKHKIKIGGIGVSIGPFKTIKDEKAVQEYLKHIDFLALRDEYSYNYAQSLNLPYKPINAFDLAALLPEVYSFDKAKTKIKETLFKKKTIGISVCPYESIVKRFDISFDIKEEKSRNENVVELIKELDRLEDIHFKFYIINGNEMVGDRTLTYETIKNSSPKSFEVIDYNINTQSTWMFIAECDFVISTRLHAAIFACFAEVPFMLNEYHRKCEDFLDNVGYEESYRLYNNKYDVKEKASQIISILQDNNYKKPLYVADMKSRAKLNFTSIKL